MGIRSASGESAAGACGAVSVTHVLGIRFRRLCADRRSGRTVYGGRCPRIKSTELYIGGITLKVRLRGSKGSRRASDHELVL